jgi:hypothetical protein
MKKRWIALLAVMAMVFALGLTLTACGSGGSEETAGSAEPAEQEEPAEEPNLADQLEVVYEKAYNEKSSAGQQAIMLVSVKNNSDKTLNIAFRDTGVDKDGGEVVCEPYGDFSTKVVGPGETRWIKQVIEVKDDDVNNIDHMSGGSNAERFTVEESSETSFGEQVKVKKGIKKEDDGLYNIMATNNSEYTGSITAYFLFKDKNGDPVYLARTPLANLEDGEIKHLAPGESTEEAVATTCGGNKYKDYEVLVVGYTGEEE